MSESSVIRLCDCVSADQTHGINEIAGAPLQVNPTVGDLRYGEPISFKSLLSSGALKKSPYGTYDASNGYTRGELGLHDIIFGLTLPVCSLG